MPADDPTRAKEMSAGGVLLALGAIGGAVVGYLFDQPSAGFVIGVGSGAAATAALWLRDRARG